jgi:ParB family chromosome partitioning protein
MTTNTKKAQTLRVLNKDNDSIAKTDLFKIDPRIIKEEPGFNTRGLFCDDYWEREEVKEGIQALANAYIKGEFVPPIVVKVVDGEVFVRDGHRRKRGMLQAISQGANIQKVDVIENKGDEVDQTALIVTSNSGEPLSPVERAAVYARLQSYGLSDKEIADKVGKSAEHVRKTREIDMFPLNLKKLIQDKVVSATLAQKLFDEHGTDAVSMIKEQVEESKDSDNARKKVTARTVAKTPRYTKKVVTHMSTSLRSLTADLDKALIDGDGKYRIALDVDQMKELVALKELLDEIPLEVVKKTKESNSNEGQQTLPV